MNRPIYFSTLIIVVMAITAACDDAATNLGENESTNSDPEPEATSSWIKRAPLPTPRQEVPHEALNGKIYVPGGLLSFGLGSNIVEVFDPSTDSWSSAPSLSVPVHHTGLTNHKGVLYLMGGYGGSGFTPTDDIYVLHPHSSNWNSVGLMPIKRGAHVIESFGDKIYVFGGVTPLGLSNGAMSYDPVTKQWETLSSMPTHREHLASAVLDSLIYLVGGRDFSQTGSPGNLPSLEAYSPETDRWYILENMPTARGGLAAAALTGQLSAFGGESPGVFAKSEEYDTKTD